MTGILLRFLGHYGTTFLASGVFAGLLLPPLAAALRPLLEAAVVLLLTVTLLQLDWRALGAQLHRPGLALAAVTAQLFIAPPLVWGLTLLVGLPGGLAAALVLHSAGPSLTAAPALAQLLDLDAPLAVAMVVASTLLLPLALIAASVGYLGLSASFDAAGFAGRVALFILLPFALAGVLKRLIPAARLQALRQPLDGINVLLLLLVAVAVMEGVTARLLAEPWTVAAFLAAAFALNIGLNLLGALAFWHRGRHQALSLGLCIGNRNAVIILVLMAGLGGPDLALYVALAQLPIYMMPLLVTPLYRRLLR